MTEPDAPVSEAEPGEDTPSQEDTAPPAGSGDDELKRARGDAAKYRKQLRATEAELKQIRDAQLSDTERRDQDFETLKTANGDLERENRSLRVQVAAAGLGIVDPEAAAALLDWTKVEDPSDPKQVEKALRELVKERTWLSGTAQGFGGGEGNDRPADIGEDMNARIRQAAGVRR